MKSTLKTATKFLMIITVVGIAVIGGMFSLMAYHDSDLYVDAVTREAVQKNDASICMKIQPAFMSSQPSPYPCVIEVAVQNRTIQSCVMENSLYEYSSCFQRYFERLPTDDLSICAVFQHQLTRDQCYFGQSYQFGTAEKETICSVIQDPYKKRLCKNTRNLRTSEE
ncbi:MAG: hypothetical protein PHX93_05760 [Candidatus Peribacteraceae bacterium]|jgi:hypothetical protein|nr:hypothetical protein [Candidatus Peribacteraceae bacterium]